MKLTLKEKRVETSDVISFIFTPQGSLSWKAGQFLHYFLPHPNPDQRKIDRFFTIASASFEGVVRLTTRFAKEHGSSFKKALFDLEVGSEIETQGPGGSFIVDDPLQSYVFLAGGIGITPFRSILLDLDHSGKPVNVTLLYGNRNTEIVYQDELDSLAAKHPSLKIHYLIDPQKIDLESIKSLVPNIQLPVYYLSGPEPMVKAMEEMLANLKIPKEKIKLDYFPGYTD